MIEVAIDEIIVPENRQRKQFTEKAIDELGDSILSKGLMHPLVVRDDGRTLVAGERRLRALNGLYLRGAKFTCGGKEFFGSVPCTRLGELSPLEVLEAELEENTIRLDLTWQERSEAIARLHELRVAQAEDVGEKHTMADSARELLDNIGLENASLAPAKKKVSDALVLAEHLSDPDVAAAKSERDAMKIIRKKSEAAHRARLAAEFGEIETAHEFHHGDTFEILPSIEGNFPIMLTDPPYGIEASGFGDQAGAKHEYKDDLDFAIKCYALCFANADRLNSRVILAFCDIRIHPTLVQLAQQLIPSFSIWDTPLIWNKGNGMLPVPDKGPRRNYEAIFYAYRGNTLWSTTGSSDIFDIPAVPSPTFGAEKPPALYSDLLSRVALPGDRVIDPFAGTCPIIGAANELQLVATCIEQNEEKLNFAKVKYHA